MLTHKVHSQVASLRDQLTEDELSLLTQDATGSTGSKGKPSKSDAKRTEAKAEVHRRRSTKPVAAAAAGK
jgi:hypothetical protein